MQSSWIQLALTLLVLFCCVFLARSYITDITVVAGRLLSTSCPSGYSRYYYNLNDGAGGDYVYLCYKTGVRNPITGLNVIAGTSTTFPIQYGYTKVNVDLNSGIGRDNIYLIYTKSTTLPPIASLTVRGGTTPYVYPPSTWVRIDTDCNQNAGGRYIYICYYQPRDWLYSNSLLFSRQQT